MKILVWMSGIIVVAAIGVSLATSAHRRPHQHSWRDRRLRRGRRRAASELRYRYQQNEPGWASGG